MPTLPSGLKLALSYRHIMQPDLNWFRTPPGHFWYWTPCAENQPPFASDQSWEAHPTKAPVPASRAEMEHYIQVVFGLPNGKYYWRGEMLSEFPKYGELDLADQAAWQEWLQLEETQEFLDEAIVRCRTQAEVNQEASGIVRVTDLEPAEDGLIKGAKVVDDPTRRPH